MGGKKYCARRGGEGEGNGGGYGHALATKRLSTLVVPSGNSCTPAGVHYLVTESNDETTDKTTDIDIAEEAAMHWARQARRGAPRQLRANALPGC